jgi:hypothetical protein
MLMVCAAVAVTQMLASALPVGQGLQYVKKETRRETVLATLRANGVPTLEGRWYCIGPFAATANEPGATVHPPERAIDLTRSYPGKNGQPVSWKEFPSFQVAAMTDLKALGRDVYGCFYLYHQIDAPTARTIAVGLGGSDALAVWLNGERLSAGDIRAGTVRDVDRLDLHLKAGKNRLLLKVCSVDSEWSFYVRPRLPRPLEAELQQHLDRDFPYVFAPPSRSVVDAEAVSYRIVTLPVPPDIILEVGGLGFRPDGKLYCCTRRGDVCLISHPETEDPARVRYQRFATGLHEPLGLLVDGARALYIVQRPELTRLVDTDGDDVADRYDTVCDRWGISGDYHEFAYGPARDRAGNFYVTLNVGFGGGHQSKAPWRGWCVQIRPDGTLLPFATGLRSPNGIAVSPDGDLFCTDNQGEWVASNKLLHVRPGEYYGHKAGLRWLSSSPFAGRFSEDHPSGMLYDGQPGQNGVRGLPPVTPPCVWFPYGRMGQSASEPVWDTTGGRFGPFAGQCFVGDQTKACIMRVCLEKVRGRYQGACFPFCSGFECGVNRLTFGPDGSLYVGMTNRGWGSVGGKAYGLQRLLYTGMRPFEILALSLDKGGFVLTFTKPLDPSAAARTGSYSVQSYTYNYWSTYGSPEVDHRAEKVEAVTVSPDRRRVRLQVAGLCRGRVYEVHLEGVRSADGEPLLHPDGYYTVNELP